MILWLRTMLGCLFCATLLCSSMFLPDASLPVLPATPLAQVKGEWNQVPVELRAEWPKPPATMMVYRIIYPQVNQGYAQILARAFALGDKAESNGRSWMASAGRRALEIYTETGAFWFKDAAQLWSGQRPATLPTERDAQVIAERLLREKRLLLPDLVFESIGQSSLTIYDVATASQTQYNTDIHVNFRLMVGGAPVEGAGGKVKAYLGAGGQLIGLYWAGFDVLPFKLYPLIAPQAAIAILQEQGIVSTLKSPRRVTVSEIRLAYFVGPGTEAQEFLQPVYVLSGTVENEAESAPYSQYVPAIKEQYLKASPAPTQSLSKGD